MKFETRKEIIRELLIGDGLMGYTPPRGMGDDDQEQVILRVVDALNRKLPIVDEAKFREMLGKTFTNVHDVHDGYAWPTQAEFVRGLPAFGIAGAKSTTTYETDKAKHIAKLVGDRQPLNERDVWGSSIEALVGERVISQDDVDRYRQQSAKDYAEVYKDSAKDMMANLFGHAVNRYFQA